jgi:hypothetical protein
MEGKLQARNKASSANRNKACPLLTVASEIAA